MAAAQTIDTGDLGARVVALEAGADRMTMREMLDELEALRRIALARGIGPAVAIIHAIDQVLAKGERGALVHGWLAILGDAMACGRGDAIARETYAAACSVRLAGG